MAPDSQFQWEPEKEQGIRVGHQKAGRGEGDHAEPRKKGTSNRKAGRGEGWEDTAARVGPAAVPGRRRSWERAAAGAPG